MGTQPRPGFERVPPRRFEDTIPPVEEVTVPNPPTDDQLANTAVVLGFPILATPLFMRMPHWRQAMLNLHALLVRTLNGDEDAARSLAQFQVAFGEKQDLTEIADELKNAGGSDG